MFWVFPAQSSCGEIYNQLCTGPNPCSIDGDFFCSVEKGYHHLNRHSLGGWSRDLVFSGQPPGWRWSCVGRKGRIQSPELPGWASLGFSFPWGLDPDPDVLILGLHNSLSVWHHKVKMCVLWSIVWTVILCCVWRGRANNRVGQLKQTTLDSFLWCTEPMDRIGYQSHIVIGYRHRRPALREIS